jgi:hypothetical protein
VIHVPDERLVRLIAIGKKTAHRFPAQRKAVTGEVTHPKIVAGKVHKVYTEAPFGRDGNPDAQPLLEVMINEVELDVLGDMTEEDARREGFSSVAAFKVFWDRIWYHKALRFDTHLYHPVWIVSFHLEEVLPAGKKVIRRVENAMKKREGSEA